MGFSATFSSDEFFPSPSVRGVVHAKDLDNARDFGVGSQPKANVRDFFRENFSKNIQEAVFVCRVGQPFFV